MEIEFTKKFSKQIDSIRDESLKSQLSQVVRNVMLANSLYDIANLKKLKGYRLAYRIKMGDYRIGLFLENGVFVFVCLAHRKDIYDKFP